MISLSNIYRSLRLQHVVDGLSGGTLTLYTNPLTVVGGAITSQTPLATFQIPPSLIVSGYTVLLNLNSAIASGEGACTWGRIVTSSGAHLLDADAGELNSSAFFRLKNVNIVVGMTLNITISQISEP